MSDSFDNDNDNHNNNTDSVNNYHSDNRVDNHSDNLTDNPTNNLTESDSEDENVYNFERKKKLANRINGIRDKPLLRAIRDIIYSENPGIIAKKSSGGYLMYFQNYTPSTYLKINNAINKYEARKKERISESNSSAKFSNKSNKSNTITESSEKPNITSSEEPNEYNGMYTRLRYSNRERRLIKRQQYEDIINEQIDEIITHSASNMENSDTHLIVAPKESNTKDSKSKDNKNTKKTKTKNTKTKNTKAKNTKAKESSESNKSKKTTQVSKKA